MLRRNCLVICCLLGTLKVLSAAEEKPDPTPHQIQDIIKKFTQKETEFANARESYTYRQTSKIVETRPGGRQLRDCRRSQFR